MNLFLWYVVLGTKNITALLKGGLSGVFLHLGALLWIYPKHLNHSSSQYSLSWPQIQIKLIKNNKIIDIWKKSFKSPGI